MRSGRISEVINDGIEQNDPSATIGKVTKVYEKETQAIEEGNIEANVQTRSSENELRQIPVLAFDHTGHVSVPQKGDYVLVERFKGRGNAMYITDIVYTKDRRSPVGRQGHWRHEFGHPDDDEKVYLEAEPADHSGGDPDLVRMGVKPDGLDDPTTEVAVDNSGDQTQIRIETDGDIHINAGGDILVGGVSLEDHQHEYTQDDGETKTTGPMQ